MHNLILLQFNWTSYLIVSNASASVSAIVCMTYLPYIRKSSAFMVIMFNDLKHFFPFDIDFFFFQREKTTHFAIKCVLYTNIYVKELV